jgi:hypothetical protein
MGGYLVLPDAGLSRVIPHAHSEEAATDPEVIVSVQWSPGLREPYVLCP